MTSCDRRVYRTMCEHPDGTRTGRYKKNRYSSVPVDGPKKPVSAKKKAKTSKTTTKTVKSISKPVRDYEDEYDRHLDRIEAEEQKAIQKMYLEEAWRKRQASKRKKYGTSTDLINAFIADLIKDFDKIYERMYNRGETGTMAQVESGDRFIKNHPKLVAAFNKARQDILSSDREVVAFERAVKKSEYRDWFYALDPISKKPAKREPGYTKLMNKILDARKRGVDDYSIRHDLKPGMVLVLKGRHNTVNKMIIKKLKNNNEIITYSYVKSDGTKKGDVDTYFNLIPYIQDKLIRIERV